MSFDDLAPDLQDLVIRIENELLAARMPLPAPSEALRLPVVSVHAPSVPSSSSTHAPSPIASAPSTSHVAATPAQPAATYTMSLHDFNTLISGMVASGIPLSDELLDQHTVAMCTFLLEITGPYRNKPTYPDFGPDHFRITCNRQMEIVDITLSLPRKTPSLPIAFLDQSIGELMLSMPSATQDPKLLEDSLTGAQEALTELIKTAAHVEQTSRL